MNITLNVSGQNFEVHKDILMKIPYFKDMFDACSPLGNQSGEDTPTESIFIARPPHIFKHVLSYIIDPIYPFPKKYMFELDFYNITYDKTYFYDKEQELIHKVNDMQNECDKNYSTVKTQLKNMSKKVDTIEKYVYLITNKCKYNNCPLLHTQDSLFCENHIVCLVNGENISINKCDKHPYRNCNYCLDHYKTGVFCDRGGCSNIRENKWTEFCNEHR
jgi:hypothetical protein